MTQFLNSITLSPEKKESFLLPMGGKDSKGNLYEVDTVSLLKNGKRFIPIMGEFHFSRYEPESWEEELLKIRAGGITVVATYVFWIHHEEKPGEWNFSGSRNLRAFLALCRKLSFPLWLRIGPWCHGECRNGGFPDWIVNGKYQERTNDPAYLAQVQSFYQKLGEQSKGMMCKDGGPVLGIQLENEFGHCCGGPSTMEEGLKHLSILKKMAIQSGFSVPYYTVTGWGGAYALTDETLPVLGGYVDAPWAEHVEEMPASDNFLFSSYKQDENIGSDLAQQKNNSLRFDIHRVPYLTAELGGGLQVTSHRRPYPWPEDIEAQTLCMLGSGANLLGYYMYHGGINPKGKYSTLQESRATGYSNDLPIKNYDFQTCIRESGKINASFGRLKKIHLLISDFEEVLAASEPCFAEIQPDSPEDLTTVRVAARVNQQLGFGFLFINNHQRKRTMSNHENFAVRLRFQDTLFFLPHLSIQSGECACIPFQLPHSPAHPFDLFFPLQTNASLLCALGDLVFFYSDSKNPFFNWKQPPAHPIVLSTQQANRAFKCQNKLFITEHDDSCIIEEHNRIYLLTTSASETLLVYHEKGDCKKIELKADPIAVSAKSTFLHEVFAKDRSIAYRDYLVTIEKESSCWPHQLYVVLDYVGDRVEVYENGELLHDWFTTGEKWHLSLRRFGYPTTLTVRVFPSDKPIDSSYENQVYYDLPVENGCALHDVKAYPEYKISYDVSL
ncbi:MAG: hypothetical protein GX786_08660 [Clostridiales bacterium]|nr:hypothetical protein [Clostridiales bacterium]